MTTTPLPPLIKWSGSKRSVAPLLARTLPQGGTYFEPFLGGGSVLGTQAHRRAVVGDTIGELIDIWNAVKNDPDHAAKEYSARWSRLQGEGHTAYYDVRASFNESRNPHDLLFLSRTCVNGLIRFNKAGDFNNSLHHTRKGINPARFESIIKRWSDVVQGANFVHADFEETLSKARPGDVAFLDPPYVGTRGRYLPTDFDYPRFWQCLERLNGAGVRWILTLDGSAGERQYESETVPADIYVRRFALATGSSPFSRVMEGRVDHVRESVFMNFDGDTETAYMDKDEF